MDLNVLVCLAQQILMKDKRDRTKSLQTPRREPSESLWNEKTKIEKPPKKRQELVVFKVFQVGSTGGGQEAMMPGRGIPGEM